MQKYIVSREKLSFIGWFHEFSVTMNLQILQETVFVYLFLCAINQIATFIFAENFLDLWLKNL